MEVLTYPGRKPINWANPPGPRVRVSSDLICGDGVRFTGSMRTVCHMAWMMDVLPKKYTLHVIQPPFNRSVPSSAGTHDYDCASDVTIYGMGWLAAQWWLRSHGFDCWWRHTGPWAALSKQHIHGFTHPASGWTFATRVGIYLPGQLLDYKNHATGLAGQHAPGSDRTRYPANPHSVAFNLARYIRTKQEETMEYKDWSDASKKAMANDVVNELLSRKVDVVKWDGSDNTQKVDIKEALTRAGSAIGIIRRVVKK